MFMILFLIFSLSSRSSQACEPYPAVGVQCGKSQLVPLHKKLVNDLIAELSIYEGYLKAAEIYEKIIPLEKESCGSGNFALSHFKGLTDFAAQHNNQICLKEIQNASHLARRLLSKKHWAFKRIENQTIKSLMHSHRTRLLSKLKKFKKAH